MENINQGSVVSLKCGGPPMVVEEITSDNQVRCYWFDTDEQLHREYIPSTILEILEPQVCEKHSHQTDA